MKTGMEDVPVLDGMRALAVSIVLIAHAGFNKIVPGGFGVTLFFFLSGFLITSLMRGENERTGTVSLRNFYLRRSLRIIPPLYITLGLSALLVGSGLYPKEGYLGVHGPVAWSGVLSQLFFVQNYSYFWGDPIGLPITGIWSLAVEEHYYLFFPLFYLLVLRHLSQARQVMVCLAICAAALGLRFFHAETWADYGTNYVFTHTRLDSILFGAMLALANNPVLDRDAWRAKGWHAALGVLVIVATLAIRGDYFRETLRYTLQGGALYLVFSYVMSGAGPVQAALSSAPARLIARYSYTLYLIHLLLIGQMLAWLTWWPAVIVAVALSFMYAVAMYHWVERPLGKLRRRLEKARLSNYAAPAVVSNTAT